MKYPLTINPEMRQALFLAGALSAKHGTYLPPADRDAARHFNDGSTLARQGFINIVDPVRAKAEIEQLRERSKAWQTSRR